MLSDKQFDQIIHAIGNKSTASLLLFSRRVFALCSGGEYFKRCDAGLMQRHATIRADRVFAQSRSRASGAIEHNKNLTAPRGDLDAEAGTATVPINDFLGWYRQRIDRTLGELNSRHGAVRL